jgi:hypothetical protein
MQRRIFLMVGTIAAGSASFPLLSTAVPAVIASGIALEGFVAGNWLTLGLVALFAVGHVLPLLPREALDGRHMKSNRGKMI